MSLCTLPSDTPRLGFRELDPGDLDFVAGMLADPVVMRYYPKALTREEAADWIERQRERYRRDGHGLWLVSERATGQPVGQVGLLRQMVAGRAEWEIGYLLHRAFWHRGYATEAGHAIREYSFQALRPTRVISLIRPENDASQRVARRLGLQPAERVQFAGLEHIVFAIGRPNDDAGSSARRDRPTL